MRKVYILKRLTGQVKRFAALMLIVLMAAGNVFAEEVTCVFSEKGFTNEQVIGSGNINEFISFTSSTQSSATAGPKYFNSSSDVRFYSPKSGFAQGNEMTLIPASGYKITGLVIYAKNNYTPTLGCVVDGVEVESAYTLDGTVYTFSGFEALQSLKFYNANTTSKQLRTTSITIIYETSDAPVVAVPTFSHLSGTYYKQQTISLSCSTPGANIFYSINDGDPILYNDAFTVNTTSTISAYAEVGETTSPTSTITLTFPEFVELANIAAFYQGVDEQLYKITGDVQYVWRSANNDYMYVQDATGGLLIYDVSDKISTQYNNGDVISGGLIGTLDLYNGLVELKPVTNTDEGVAGAAIQPEEVTVAQILANPDQYMSKLVILKNGQFAPGAFTNNSTSNITFMQDGSSIVVRSQFKNLFASFSEGNRADVVGFVSQFVSNNDTTIQLFPRDNSDITLLNATLPYSCTFQGSSSEMWQIANGTTNKWYVGQAQGFDNDKLYISSSNGATNKYNVSTADVSHAYVMVALPNSDVLLNFDCRSVGNANDYLQVSVLDEVPEAGTLPETYLARIYGVDAFVNQQVLIPASYAGMKYLVFTWVNDNANGTQTPAAIDNVTMEATCTQVSNLAAAVNNQTAVITWNAPAGQDAWTVEYKAANADVWQSLEADETTVTLNNLSTETDYQVRVKANCGNDNSAWVMIPFTVPCMTLTTSQEDITIGEGTSTGYNAPMNCYYKNSWTQMVYPASEFSMPGYINSLGWYVNAAQAHSYQTLKIYLGTKSSAINESTTDWLPMEDLTLVYENNNGTVGSTAGWETFTLNTPYYYNGEDNLVVVVARTADNYKMLYYRYTSTPNSVLYRRNDNNPENYGSHPGTNYGSRIADLPNMRIDFTGYVCGDEHCAVPAELTVNDVTTDGAVLNWEAGDATAWQLSYKAEDAADWTTVNVTENTYTLAGLDQNTTYMVRVMADCGTIGMSNEAALSFTTVAACLVPEELTAVAHTHTVNVSWLPVEGVSNYEVEVKNGDMSVLFNQIVANASQTNVTGLQEGVQYIISVRALCDEELTSDWTTINFTMPTICPPVSNVTVTDIEQNSATVTWNGGDETSCIVEYGYKGFNLGEGIQVVVDGNSAVLTGLDVFTEYDVYVKADCGLGYTSNWSPKKSFMTECGILTITPANPFFENFDTRYTGSGVQALKDCWTAPVTYTADNGTFPAVLVNWAEPAHSGSNTLEVKGNDGMFTLPEFSNDITTLQINFWANTTATDAAGAGTMEVGVLNDLDDPTSFVVVSEIELTAFGRPNTRQYGPYSFENVTPVAGQRIAFRYANTNAGPSWNFDDFTVELIPDCQTPSDVEASDLTPITAVISWTENGNATAWNIEYGPAGFEQGEGTLVAASTNPFTVAGLDPATTYDFYVQASCGQDITSAWGEKATATTLCAAIHVTAENPWFEDFEGYTGSGEQPLICWETPVTSTISNHVYPLVYCGHAPACHSGVNSAELKGNSNMLVLPEFDNNIYDLQVSFWATRYGTSYGSMEVGYITDLEDETTFVSVGTTPGPVGRPSSGNGGTFMGTYMFPYSAPANARIALKYTSTSTYYSWNLDDFTVSLAPTCRESSDLTVTDVTTNSAVVTWTPGGLENAWTFQYMASSADDWTTVNATTPSVTINNLAPSTDYAVRVRPGCADENMPWLNGQFTTQCANPIPGIMDVVIGEATTNGHNNPPMCNFYNNSYAEMVYPASEFSSEGDIYSIAFYVNNAASLNYSSLNIYMGTRSSSTYSGTSDWTPSSDLTLVYSSTDGTLGTATGWETFTFDNPYHYNGDGNLVVVVSRRGSAYSSSLKYRYTSQSNTVLYKQQDGAMAYEFPVDNNVTGTRGGNLPNIKINITGFVCGDEHCTAPENLAVSDVNATTATLTWNAGNATAWRVGYKVAGTTEWTSVDVTDNTYTLTDLTATTSYDVRVKTLCSGDESEYVTANFKTTMVVEQLPYVTDFTGNDWLLNNGTCTNKWYMGAPSGRDYTGLFISDDGNTPAYTITSYSVVSAEKLFAMPADDSVHVSFDLESGGESSYDYLKVFLTPSTVEFPAATSSTTSSGNAYSTDAFDFSDYKSQTGQSSYPYMINLTQGNVIHIDMMVPNPAVNGQAKLVFLWKNDGTTGTQPGAIVSNLVVGNPSTCLVPTDLASTPVNADGASTITWTAGGDETSWNLTYAMEGENSTIVPLTEPTYTLTGFNPGDSYEVSVVAVCDDENMSAPATITVSMPALVDIALVDVYTNISDCDLSNAIAQITVENVREGSTINAFMASYSVNGGDPVVENVLLPDPLEFNEIYTYTFTTAPVMTAGANVITATVLVEGESNLDNNTKSSGTTYLTEVKTIPYVENFSSAAVANEWPAEGNMFITNGAIQYVASDETGAAGKIVSPCIEFTPYVPYLFSFDYKANSPFYTEKFNAYVGPNADLLGSFNFNNTEYAHFSLVLTADVNDVISHLTFESQSPAGTDGFSIDNISIKKAVSFTVMAGANGSATAENTYNIDNYHYSAEGEAVTLVMTPDLGYHVSAIYVNNVLVRGENETNASVDYFTFTPNFDDVVTVLFAPNKYQVNATVINQPATAYNNNAPGATYTPAHETLAHGEAHTGVITLAPYFHLESVTVNGAEVNPVPVNGKYYLTLDPVMENKDIQVVTGINDATIKYTVNAGQGTINNTYVVDADATYPAVYTVTLPGYSSLLSTITPAPGYHVESVSVDGVDHSNIEAYSFEHLLGDHTVNVTFALNHYVITTHSVGNGTVSDGEDFDYNPDYTYTFTAIPDEGYLISSITRNNIPMNIANPADTFTEVLTNILSDYNYEVVFTQQIFSVTATAGEHGTVTPSGVTNYYYHQNAVIEITADYGYYIFSVTYDGDTFDLPENELLSTLTIPFLTIEENHTLNATFAPIIYEVTVNAGTHGEINHVSGGFGYGETPTYEIVPDEGYAIVDVTVDGESVGAVSTYTFLPLTDDHTIAATFAAQAFTITATAGVGGTITPSGVTSVTYNGNKSFTISANTGYQVSDVLVDGASVGAVTTYSFNNVTANHTIFVTFAVKDYTIAVTQPSNGAITPGTTTVNHGADQAFVIAPNVGYKVNEIKVNGNNVNLSNVPNVNGIYTYTFENITADKTLTATMVAKTFTITASAGDNGSITPNGDATVNYGGTKAYTFTPNSGYVVDNVKVDNINLGALTAYTFTNVVANHTIEVTFKPVECEVPSFLYTSHVSCNSAQLHWSHPTPGMTFDIRYKIYPNGTLTSVSNVSGNSYELTGLTANTTYLWQVRANCSSTNHSEWSDMVSFTTDEAVVIGIEDLVKSSIKVYAEHQNVHILNNEGMNIENVRIFDTYGKLIYNGAVNTSHEVINLNVAVGTYIVSVTTDEGVDNYKVVLMK